MGSSPRVSILMTVYNAGAFLRPAIDCLLAQTYKNFELILVNDGSVDGSREIVQAYAAADPRIVLIDLVKNGGRTPALNLALARATGEYVAVLDADDLTVPERLARQVELLDAEPDIVMVATHLRFIDARERVMFTFSPPVDRQALYNMLPHTNPLAHSSSMFRRQAAVDGGGYPSNYVFAQDFALWLVLTRYGKIAMIGEPMTDIRDHDARMTQNPRIALLRLREEIELFGAANALPGMSEAALKLGRQNLARLHFRKAKLLLKSQPGAALSEFRESVRIAPLYLLKRGVAGVLGKKPNTGPYVSTLAF